MRKPYGSFKSVDDLLAIRGLGPKRLEKMRKYLTVGKTPPAKNNPAKENVLQSQSSRLRPNREFH